MPISFKCPECGAVKEADDRFAGLTDLCEECGEIVTIPAATGLGESCSEIVSNPASNDASMEIAKPTISFSIPPSIYIVLAVVGVLFVFLFSVVLESREPTRRMSCANNLKQLALGMHNYYDAYNTFPPAFIPDENGRPMHSWRVLILPFIEQQPLYEQYDFDKPWDDPANAEVLSVDLNIFHCPSSSKDPGETNYVMVIGPNTFSNGPQGSTFGDITDGTSNTIMFVETTGLGIRWAEPRDIDERTYLNSMNRSSRQKASEHPGGSQVSFADESVRFLSARINPQTLQALLTRDGGEIIPEDEF